MATRNPVYAARKRLASTVRLTVGAFSARPTQIPESRGARLLTQFAGTYTNLEEWKHRASRIREGILRGAGLVPMPTGEGVRMIARRSSTCPRYTVENVAFESFPGFFVSGNLYRPSGNPLPGPQLPAVLVPHGHTRWWRWPLRGRFSPEIQTLCATLAQLGAVVLAYDMVGWGESRQLPHGRNPDLLTYQLWNSLRCVDLLVSLPGIDPGRIGVCGFSGGATQAILLAAVDARVKVSIPVAQVSAHFYGGCVCERGLPIHSGPDHHTNNAEIAALAAPRPQLIVSTGGDWTRNTPRVEYPYIRHIYDLYGATGKVENLHLPGEGHDYGYSKRLGVYRFVARHLCLDYSASEAPDGEIEEARDALRSRSELSVFDAKHPRPGHSVRGRKRVLEAFRQLERRSPDRHRLARV